MAHCIVKNKDVNINVVHSIKDNKGKVVAVFFGCSNSYIDIEGFHIKSKCDMQDSQNCILKVYGEEIRKATIEALNKQNK